MPKKSVPRWNFPSVLLRPFSRPTQLRWPANLTGGARSERGANANRREQLGRLLVVVERGGYHSKDPAS